MSLRRVSAPFWKASPGPGQFGDRGIAMSLSEKTVRAATPRAVSRRGGPVFEASLSEPLCLPSKRVSAGANRLINQR